MARHVMQCDDAGTKCCKTLAANEFRRRKSASSLDSFEDLDGFVVELERDQLCIMDHLVHVHVMYSYMYSYGICVKIVLSSFIRSTSYIFTNCFDWIYIIALFTVFHLRCSYYFSMQFSTGQLKVACTLVHD